jgi:F-type H+-transporting ATPase subunit delta
MADTYAVEQAKVIFKTALESQELNRWQSNLRILASLARDKTLVAMLENPEISFNDKAKELAERLGYQNSEFLKVLSELIGKGKLSEIDDISIEYQRMLDNHRGIEGTETAEITTAIPLDNEYILSISKRLSTLTGKPVVVTTKVDTKLVGGIIIKIGDKVIDGSVRSKLAALKKEMNRVNR